MRPRNVSRDLRLHVPLSGVQVSPEVRALLIEHLVVHGACNRKPLSTRLLDSGRACTNHIKGVAYLPFPPLARMVMMVEISIYFYIRIVHRSTHDCGMCARTRVVAGHTRLVRVFKRSCTPTLAHPM